MNELLPDRSTPRVLEVSPEIRMPSGMPGGLRIFLRCAVVIILACIVIVPSLPDSWILAVNPATGAPYNILRGHMTVVRFNLVWGCAGLTGIPILLRALFAVVVVALMIIGRRIPGKEPFPREPLVRENRLTVWALLFVVPLILYVIRIPYGMNIRFGDGATIPGDIDSGMVFQAEILTGYAFRWASWLMRQFDPAFSTVDAIALVSAFSGGVFAAGAWLFTGSLTADRIRRRIYTAGLVTAGYATMFLGYVETTQIELAAMMLLFAVLARVVSSGREGIRAKIIVLSALSCAMLLHGGGLLLVPAYVVYAMTSAGGKSAGVVPVVPSRLFNHRRLIGALMLVALPYYLLLAALYMLGGKPGNLAGGADGIMFVPLSFNYVNPVSPLISYSLFSLWHAADIASACFVAAPLGLPLAAGLLITAGGRRIPLAASATRILLVLGTAAVATLAIPLVWNHDWGMWGDWNLAATYLFPLNLFGWTGLMVIDRASPFTRREFVTVIVPLIVVQTAAACGLVLQLY